MKRWGFLVGAVLFIGIIVLMSNVIWRIDISGYKDKTQLIAVEKFLKENGLCVGAIRGMLDEQTLRRDLMRNFDDVAGATVNFFGSVAVVELEQAVPNLSLIHIYLVICSSDTPERTVVKTDAMP